VSQQLKPLFGKRISRVSDYHASHAKTCTRVNPADVRYHENFIRYWALWWGFRKWKYRGGWPWSSGMLTMSLMTMSVNGKTQNEARKQSRVVVSSDVLRRYLVLLRNVSILLFVLAEFMFSIWFCSDSRPQSCHQGWDITGASSSSGSENKICSCFKILPFICYYKLQFNTAMTSKSVAASVNFAVGTHLSLFPILPIRQLSTVFMLAISVRKDYSN
jgi:hypothetical protein